MSSGLPATYIPSMRAVRCALAQPSPTVSLPLALTVQVPPIATRLAF